MGLGAGIDQAPEGVSAGALGEVGGAGGWSARGDGPGGGDRGFGGLGGLGTVGRGLGPGGGAPRPALRRRTEVLPPEGPSRVVGGLPREVVLRVVTRHHAEIKHCYETRLNQARQLAGKVAVLFVIDPAGAVSEAAVAESSLGSDPVEACMLRAIRRWKFPEPSGGGTVVVTFPWVFKVAGEDEAP